MSPLLGSRSPTPAVEDRRGVSVRVEERQLPPPLLQPPLPPPLLLPPPPLLLPSPLPLLLPPPLPLLLQIQLHRWERSLTTQSTAALHKHTHIV